MEPTDKIETQPDIGAGAGTTGSSINVSTTNNPTGNIYPDSTLETVQYTALSQNELNSIVNVTREYPFDYATIMFGYMMPFVLVLTLITNTLVVMVLFQRHMRTPTNIVLFTMAIVDLATLLSPSPWYFYIYTLGYHDKFLYPPIACYVHHIMTDVIPVFFHTSSIWLALLLASQRYIYVCHPTLARTWCTVPRVRKAIIIILVIAFLHQLTRFFDNTFTPIEIRISDARYPACKIEISDWVTKVNIAVYYTTYFTFRIMFVFIIPCVALITLNCLLFRALKRAEKKRTELLRTKFKLIGGEQCSVVGPIDTKRSSFIETNCINKNRQMVNEVSSTGLIMAINRKPSASALLGGSSNKIDQKQQVNVTSKNIHNKNENNSGDKNRKFLITLFQTAKRRSQNISDTGNLIDVSSTANHLASDVGVNQLVCGEQQQQQHQQLKYRSQSKMITKDRSVEESNDTCSATSSRSRGNFVHNDERHQYQIDRRSIGGDISDTEVKRGNGEEDDEMRSDRGEDDEEYTCLECATCEVDSECQRCSAGAKDGATGGSNQYHNHLHQAMSQCSSLMEGATNTTMNDEEDVSSCAIIQNASSSMYVIHGGNSETIETGSMREEAEANGESGNHKSRKNSSLQNIEPSCAKKDVSSNQSTKGNNNKSQTLTASGSIDSRLTCGCLLSRQSENSKRDNQKSKATRCGKNHCRECCIDNQCKRRMNNNSFRRGLSYSASRKLARHSPKCVTSCSNSDPCMNCNIDNCLVKGGDKTDLDRDICSDEMMKATIPTSQSDYTGGADAGAENSTNPYDASIENRPPCTNTTTTTTTTTLYSTKTNSMGSLIQAPSSAKGPSQSGAQHSIHMKRPSIASTTGRGSRATLGGGSTTLPVAPMAGPVVSTTNASLRTMDSNRTTLMLIVVVTVFLMVEVPVAISHILHVVFNSFDAFKDIEFASSLNYIKLFTNFFIMISYSVNFTIYCSMSKKFRETFRDLFLCGKRAKRKRAKRLLYQQQQQQQQSQYYTQHHFNIQETQLIPSQANVNSNNTNTNLSPKNLVGNRTVQLDDSSGHVGGINHNNTNNTSAGVMRYSPYARTGGKQEECEL